MKIIWNKAWIEGNFPFDWKYEDRILIPKLGKDDYNDCNAYRTVSVTSALGKRFEHITSQRLIGVLQESHFDFDQFAYLKNRSATQAVLVVIENIKKALIQGEQAAAVFFDFTDAFGSVNRHRLLFKLANDFGISGKLFQHLESFLCNRLARIKYDESIGYWIQSFFGTSAGTSLGPLLFIVQIHDVPKSIKPKFADDLVAVSVGRNIMEVKTALQRDSDLLLNWAKKEGMQINADKTKLMVFGNQASDITVKVNGIVLENVNSFKYLGVMLDKELNFAAQVDYAVSKAKRACVKVGSLMDGRRGVNVQIGVELYKSLVRPHLEYALPAWANISDKDMDKLESTQVQCLRRILGAKAHSSSAAVEVICGILPMRFRRRELCSRGFMRVIMKDEGHELVKLLSSSIRSGLRFCPMEYLRIMSKELTRAIDGFNLIKPESDSSNLAISTVADCIAVLDQKDFCSDLCSIGSDVFDIAKIFDRCKATESIKVFVDGSVSGSSVGCGACAAALYPVSVDEQVIFDTLAVGRRVSAFECEVEGIRLGINIAIQYFENAPSRKSVEDVYIFCDCSNAISSIDNMEFKRRPDMFFQFQQIRQRLQFLSIRITLVKVQGHSGLTEHDIVDQLSRNLAHKIVTGEVSAPANVTLDDANKLAADISINSWQRYWDNCNTGQHTYDLIPTVNTKVIFPKSRDIGISYCRMLLYDTQLKYDSHRTGTSDTPLCDCGMASETIDHFLLHCGKYETERQEMLDCLNDIGYGPKKKGSLCVSESLLLAPSAKHGVSKKDNAIIKHALFEFLEKIERSI